MPDRDDESADDPERDGASAADGSVPSPGERSSLDAIEQLAHSIRNPLEVATVHAEVARETGDLDHLDDVLAAHDRIERLVEDAIAAERGAGVGANATATDVGRVARAAWQTVPTGEHALRVRDPGEVLADERRLQELLENLFRNSVEHGSTSPDSQPRQDAVEQSSTCPPSSTAPEDATEADGTTDDAATVTVTVGGTDEGFYVADDGAGIPPGSTEQLRQPGHSTDDGGTGLGLAVVDEVAAAHGWDVAVGESEDGGARFDVTGVDRPED